MNHTQRTARGTTPGKAAATARVASAFLAILFAVFSLTAAVAQTVPVAIGSAATTLTTISGNSGHIAANAFGDAFYISQTTNILYWLPRGTTTPVSLVTGLSGGRNVYVDSSNNVYVPNTYNGAILEIPYVNGTYATGTAVGSPAACTSFTPAAPCQQFGSVGAVGGYYYQPLDLGLDSAGNMYVIDVYPNGQCASGNCILKFAKNTTGTYGYTPSLVKSNISASNNNAQLAVSPNGDVYYANGTSLYYIASGTTTATTVGSFNNPVGASTDQFGNVYVTNSSSPYSVTEFPAVNGVAQPSKQFPVLTSYVGNAVGIDNLGDIFYTGYSGGTNLNVAQINGITVGSAKVGTIVSATPTNITFSFSASTTPASIVAAGPGFTYSAGSCTGGSTYAAASSCTVNVTYTPTAVGVQRGSITLADATGAPLASVALSGIGLGAAQTSDPGTATAIGTTFTSPTGIKVDGSGNVFVVDTGANAVLRYAAGSTTSTSIGSGLLKPSSVSIDGAGNVYIADSGNGRIVRVPNLNGTLTNSAQTVIVTGIGTTLGIVLDRLGNLYVADANAATVKEYMNVGGTPSASAVVSLGTGFVAPFALATDSTGNLFVADFSAGSSKAVSEILFYGKTFSYIGSGYSKPTGIATDASGSLYIADSGNSRLLKIPFEGTSFNTNDQYLVSSTVAVPYGVALDAAGNLYVTDNAHLTASFLNRVAGTLSLGRANINTTTSALNANIGNAGNQPLTLGTPAYVATGSTTVFNVTSPSGNGCTAGGTIATGYSCVLSASFAPTTTGTFNDLLTFNSNAVNAATKTLTLTGRGLNLAVSTTTLTQTAPTGTASFGSSVTIQATIASAVSGTPTGTVSFTVDGNSQSVAPTLTGNIASITIPGLTGGAHIIGATYSGDDNYAPSSGSVTITIAKATSTTTVASGASATTPLSTVPGVSLALTASVVPGASTAPTGTVTFTAGTLTLGSASVAAVGTAFQATITTTALPAGTDTVVATYSGDVNYTSSVGTLSIITSYPTFTVTPNAASMTLSTGQTGTVALNVTSISGFAGAVVLSCTGLPANSICSFSPNDFNLASNTPQPVTMQILTGQTPIIPQPITGSVGNIGGRPFLTLVLLALTTAGLWKRRSLSGRLRTGLAALMFVLPLTGATALSGCGSGSQLFGTTPNGTYNVTVTATGTGSAAYAYTGFASGCSIVPTTSTAATCAQITAVTLTVK